MLGFTVSFRGTGRMPCTLCQARNKQNFIGQAEMPSIDYNRTMRDEVHQKISTCDQNPQQSH